MYYITLLLHYKCKCIFESAFNYISLKNKGKSKISLEQTVKTVKSIVLSDLDKWDCLSF